LMKKEEFKRSVSSPYGSTETASDEL
jgi:hypothetical protein